MELEPHNPSDHPQVPKKEPLTRRQRAARAARRTAVISAWGLLGLVVVAVMAMIGLFYWSQGEQSLASMLQLLQRQMPAGTALQAEGVTGTLRSGGQIKRLVLRQYSKGAPPGSGALTLTLEDVDIAWDWTALRDRSTKFNKLHAKKLQLADGRTYTPDGPAAPFTELVLPVGIDAPFEVELIEIVPKSGTPTVLGPLKGHYGYNRLTAQHALAVESLRYGDGTYQLKASLDAHAPLKLQLDGSGQLHVPARDQMPAQDLQVAVQANGTLAEPDGVLQVKAQLQPKQAAANVEGTQIHLDATVHPWQPQPLQQAQAQWRNLNVQDFWTQGPRTTLQGSMQLQPAPASPLPAAVAAAQPASGAASAVAPGDGKAPGLLGFLGTGRWLGKVQTSNAEAGAWDKRLLPLHTLDANLEYHHGSLLLEQFRWQLAPQANGVAGQAKYLPDQGWTGDFTFDAVDPAAIISTVEAAPLQGTLALRSDLAKDQKPQDAPVGFALALQSIGTASANANRLHFDDITAQGQWHEQVLKLSKMLLRSRGGVVQGQGSYAVPTQAAQMDLKLQMPGGSGFVKGTLAQASGQGQVQLSISQMRQAASWLQQWPGMEALRGRQLEGHAKLQASWRGGWQNNGQAMQVDALLDAPTFSMRSAGSETPLVAQNTRLMVRGRLADARIEAQSRLQQGSREVQVALQGNGGKRAGGWQAQMQALRAEVHDTLLKKRWNAVLAQPVSIHLLQRESGLQVQTGAFEIRLGGDGVPGYATVLGEPLRYLQQGSSYTVTSKGRLTGLPLGWIEVLAGSEALDQALSGDMTLNGQWDVQLGAQLRLQATLERASGDVIVLAGDSAGRGQGRVAAGTRTARLDVTSSGNRVQAHLLWDSAQAGSADVQLSTQLARSGAGWTLPGTAPLQGRVQARLPRVGVWNVFAPPGWRLRGTLQTDVAVGGTVQSPLLNGTLNADDLGVRSVVDGVAFQNGKLRARLQGRSMVIDEFSLRGVDVRTGLLSGGRVEGGSAHITGQVEWGAGGQPLAHSLQARLKANLSRLQLSSMADRMVVVSGDVHTTFQQLRLTVRGDLRVDRALVDLPEDSAPKLDDDVVVLPSKNHPKATQALARNNAPTTAQAAATSGPVLDDDVVLRPTAKASPAAAASAASAAAPAVRGKKASGKTPVRTARKATPKREAAKPATPPGLQKANPAIQADIQVGIDLGRDFRVRGFGLDTRLAGKLQVQGGPRLQDPPRLVGTITTERGSFRAYGQELQIESGSVRFTGALDNPTLDVVAIRRNIDLRVGVRLYGSAQRPLVQLFSEPPMPDAERLSWLVLGRSSYGAADAALLQQAAMALLSGSGGGVTGSLADALGLDEIGFKGGETLSSGSILLGKRFSDRFYVGYERGLDATLGTISFFFDLTKSLKLRGQTGQQSAVDLIYTLSYD